MKQKKNKLQDDKIDDEQYEKLRKHLLEKSSSKLYALWMNPKKNKQCKQIQASTKCFCDHEYRNHEYLNPQDKTKVHCKVQNCPCRNYSYVPSQGNLDFKCNCKHSHKLHDPISRRCTFLNCGACNRGFQTNYICPQCNTAFAEHVLVFESRKEMQQLGKKINENEDTFNYEQFNLGYKNEKNSKSSLENIEQSNSDNFIRIEENVQPANNNLFLYSDEPINDAEIERRKALPKQLHIYNQNGKYVKSGLEPQDLRTEDDTTKSDKIKINKDWNLNTITIEENGQQINVKKQFEQQIFEQQNSKSLSLKRLNQEEQQKILKKKTILRQLNQQIQEENKVLQQKYGHKPIDDENDIKEALQDTYIEEDQDVVGGTSAFYLFHLPNKYGLEIKQKRLQQHIFDKLVEEY